MAFEAGVEIGPVINPSDTEIIRGLGGGRAGWIHGSLLKRAVSIASEFDTSTRSVIGITHYPFVFRERARGETDGSSVGTGRLHLA